MTNTSLTTFRFRERIYGSERFRSLTRRTDLPSPRRFEPTKKAVDDVVI